MTNRKKRSVEDETAQPAAPGETVAQDDNAAAAGTVPIEVPDEAIQRLEAQADQWKEQALRLAADMDNFRRRTQRERTETWSRAQADVAARLLDALDDMGRVVSLDPDSTSVKDVLVGVQMVERKLLKELETAGLERVGEPGDKFDPGIQEAVSTIPAERREEDHTVAAVFQPGYRFGGALLRPARVQVRIWDDGGGAGPTP
jgi:molecular chaperone GrpE